MSLSTIHQYLVTNKETRLYLATPDFLLSGKVRNPRQENDYLALDVGPYLLTFFDREELHRGRGIERLLIHPDLAVTRKIQRHKEHIDRYRRGRRYLTDYVIAIDELHQREMNANKR